MARGTRDDIEARIGHTIISSERAIDHINPEGTLPLNDPEPFAEYPPLTTNHKIHNSHNY